MAVQTDNHYKHDLQYQFGIIFPSKDIIILGLHDAIFSDIYLVECEVDFTELSPSAT